MTVNQVAEVSPKYLAETLANVNAVPEGCKQTEVGIILEDWEASTIGNVTVWMSGGTPSRKNNAFWTGSIPWISGSTLKTLEISTSDKFLTEQGVESGSKMAPLNATLLLVRGSALHTEIRAGLVIAPVCFNQDVKALVPNKCVYPKYLTIYLLAMENELLKLVSSAGNSAGVLDTQLVQDFKFLKPTLPEQTAIANTLSDVDALISKLEKLIVKKQAIKTAAMQQLLSGRTRLPPFGFKESALREDGSKKGYKQTELGEIPEDWNLIELGELLQYEQPTKYLVGHSKLLEGGSLPVLTAGKSFILGYTEENHGVYVGPPVIIFDDFTTDSKYVNFPFKVKSSAMKMLKSRKASVPLNLIYNLLSSIDFIVGGHKRHWIGETQHLMVTLSPDAEEQTAIASILSDMDEEIQALAQRLGKTRQIKQGMMQELLTGKTRLVKPGKEERENA